MKSKINILVFLVFAMIFTTSCKRVVVKLDAIPENTPTNQPIFITGNFNNWDAGEEKYIMTLGSDGSYYTVLPSAFGTIEYKFTRGDWTTVEKDICGDEIDNRVFSIAETDTITNTIESWNDLDPINCPRLTILLDLLPTNTPNDEIIALASSVNSWDPDDASIFKETASGDLYVNIDRPEGLEQLLCKITRGDLSSSESDEYGNELANRVLEFGKKDTIKLSVQGWIDLPVIQSKDVVIIINSLPENTPKDEDIYMACNLNSWFPGDMNLKFQLNKQGHYYFETPRKNFTLNYKITRGDWDSEEVDENGWVIDNRTIDLQKADTVYIDIPRWKDMGQSGDDEITIILDKLPESTPSNSNFYIAGTINGWNPGRLRNKFKQDNYGNYYVNLPRKEGGFEMKITRGSWGTVQVNKDGSEAENYIFSYHDIDTIYIDIENWKDLPERQMQYVNIVIDELPENTPRLDDIYLVADFNGWNPEDDDLYFYKLDDGRPILTILTRGDIMKYKITRGGWNTVEVDEYGDEIPDRELHFGFSDTIFIKVEKWRDLDGNY